MREMPILQRILAAVGVGATRLFRNNVAECWIGKAQQVRRTEMVTVYPGDVVVRQARRLHAGLCVGSSDLIGWTTVDGRAVFTAIEVKAESGRVRPEQANFIDQVQKAGGIAGVARSDEEARAIIEAYRSSDAR